MITAHVHFPTHPNNRQPLRAGFDADMRRPGIVSVYVRRKNGHMSLIKAVLPREAIK